MKKIFVFATVLIATIVLMFFLRVNFTQAAENMTDKDMTINKGQMMMDKGKMMKEGTMDKDTMMKLGDRMMQDGKMIMDKGKKMKD